MPKRSRRRPLTVSRKDKSGPTKDGGFLIDDSVLPTDEDIERLARRAYQDAKKQKKA
jgi:hypothetical protein